MDDDDKVDPKPILASIESALVELGGMTQLLDNFYYDGKDGANRELHMHIDNLMDMYKAIDDKKESMRNAAVPLDILDHLDRVDYSNPDLYTFFKVESFNEEKERHRRMNQEVDTVNKHLIVKND